MAAQNNTLAQPSSPSLNNSFGAQLRRYGAGLAAAAQLGGGAALPAVGVGGSLAAAPVAAVTGAAFFAGTQQGKTAVMLAPGTTLPGQAYIDYGAQFANSVVAIQRVGITTGNLSYASGVIINDDVTGKQFVVTVAHALDSTSGLRPAETLSILVGSNFSTPENTITVASYAVHSTYVVGSGGGRGSEVDFAIMELGSSRPGIGTTVGSQTIPNGVVLDFAGFGQYGLSAGALQPQDGNIRAFQSISMESGGLFDNAIYNSSIASSAFNSFVKGVGAPGDSGGGVFYNGELYGIVNAGSSLSTEYIDLTNSEVKSFMRNFMDSTVVPEPSTALLAALGLGAFVFRRQRASVL